MGDNDVTMIGTGALCRLNKPHCILLKPCQVNHFRHLILAACNNRIMADIAEPAFFDNGKRCSEY